MKRTFIVDNGGSYSDHALWFVSTSLPREDVERALILALFGWARQAAVIGVADEITWLPVKRAQASATLRDTLNGEGDWQDPVEQDEKDRRDEIEAILAREVP